MIKLINENCLEYLKNNPTKYDCVVTSPPYNMNLRIQGNKYTKRQKVKEISNKYDGFTDDLDLDSFYEFHKQVIEQLLEQSNLVFYVISYVTGSKRAFFKLIGYFSDSLKDIIVWDKTHGQPSISDRTLNRRTEHILVFGDNPISRRFSNSNFNKGTLEDIWQIPIQRSNYKQNYHGATFPEKLVETVLVNFTKEGDHILDPFMGTGTTGLVCKKLNRNFTGIELVKNYYDQCVEALV